VAPPSGTATPDAVVEAWKVKFGWVPVPDSEKTPAVSWNPAPLAIPLPRMENTPGETVVESREVNWNEKPPTVQTVIGAPTSVEAAPEPVKEKFVNVAGVRSGTAL